MQRPHTVGFWSVTQTTRRSCSSWAGCTTNKAPTTLVKSRLLSTSRSQWLPVSAVFPRDPLVHPTNSHVDQTDAQSWYLLGRCYMSQQKYPKAYEAYQQAVYRDGRNPTFWCSIGVLYYQINQYRDALDAYSRAIRLNPNISEVWYDLGTLVSLTAS
jgi:tetratricopeptide (TPR) repeat protein